MDFLGVLVLLVVLYGLPELLRKRRKKNYEYPTFPEPAPTESPSESEPAPLSTDLQPTIRPHIAAPLTPHVTTHIQPQIAETVSAPSAVSGIVTPTIDTRQVMDGIIWAEILAKPKRVTPCVMRRR